jgi:hypothetical protein
MHGGSLPADIAAMLAAEFCALGRARRVVPISELVFEALTQNRSSLEDRTTTRRCHFG